MSVFAIWMKVYLTASNQPARLHIRAWWKRLKHFVGRPLRDCMHLNKTHWPDTSPSRLDVEVGARWEKDVHGHSTSNAYVESLSLCWGLPNLKPSWHTDTCPLCWGLPSHKPSWRNMGLLPKGVTPHHALTELGHWRCLWRDVCPTWWNCFFLWPIRLGWCDAHQRECRPNLTVPTRHGCAQTTSTTVKETTTFWLRHWISCLSALRGEIGGRVPHLSPRRPDLAGGPRGERAVWEKNETPKYRGTSAHHTHHANDASVWANAGHDLSYPKFWPFLGSLLWSSEMSWHVTLNT